MSRPQEAQRDSGAWRGVGAAAGLCVTAVAVLQIAGRTADDQHVWLFVILLVVSVALSAASVWLAHRSLRGQSRWTVQHLIALAVTVLTWLVLVPLSGLLGVWILAGIGSF